VKGGGADDDEEERGREWGDWEAEVELRNGNGSKSLNPAPSIFESTGTGSDSLL
jgi:hypothetical protein